MSSPTLLLVAADNYSGEEQWLTPFEEPSDGYAHGTRGRVLVVDDEITVRSLIARILEEAGYQVETASDPLSALGYLASVPGVDLVITDVRMPGMDGWELGRRIQRERPALPVLYVSGYDLVRSAPNPLLFLRKPFEAPELLGRVGRLLGEA